MISIRWYTMLSSTVLALSVITMKKNGEITCRRCHGLMVPERFLDLQDDTGQLSFYGWRCLTCGEIVDPLIQAHRAHRHRHPAAATPKNRTLSRLPLAFR